MMQENLSIYQVDLKPIDTLSSGELSDKIFRKCVFCEKSCLVLLEESLLIDKLSGNNFHCLFCLRHNLHTKNNRNFLILSFRSIIAHFYFQNHLLLQGENKLWISEIEDYIKIHCEIGLKNPLFIYDPETMLWFIDFSRIGNSKKKIALEEVFKTISNILLCFNLSETIPGIEMTTFFGKYKSAIEAFYHKRYRPESRRMLIPTLTNCGLPESKINASKLRNFSLDQLKIHKRY